MEVNHDIEGLVLNPVQTPVENQDKKINQDIKTGYERKKIG